MQFFAVCVCGHEIEDHEREYGVCQRSGCLCCQFESQEDGEDTTSHKSSSLDVYQIASQIGIDVSLWPGKCYGIAAAAIKNGVVVGNLRYGHWLGPVVAGSIFSNQPIVPHGWIETSSGSTVIDLTRWVFEGTSPYVYEGSNDFYDVAGNVWRMKNLKPPPRRNSSTTAPTKVYLLDSGGFRRVTSLLLHVAHDDDRLHTNGCIPTHLTLEERAWLLNLPPSLLGEFVHQLYTVAVKTGDQALIPIDNRRLILG